MFFGTAMNEDVEELRDRYNHLVSLASAHNKAINLNSRNFFFFTQKEAAQGHTHKKKITKKPAIRCSCQRTDMSVQKE